MKNVVTIFGIPVSSLGGVHLIFWNSPMEDVFTLCVNKKKF